MAANVGRTACRVACAHASCDQNWRLWRRRGGAQVRSELRDRLHDWCCHEERMLLLSHLSRAYGTLVMQID